MRKFYGYLKFKMCIEEPSKHNFKYLVLAIWVMEKKTHKHLVSYDSSLFPLPQKWTTCFVFLHREMAVFSVTHLALNIRIIFKIQKAEGFWQNSKIISHPSILIVLWFLSSCRGLGVRRSAVGMDVQMAQCGAICQTERKRPGFCILYSLWETTDLSSGWQS